MSEHKINKYKLYPHLYLVKVFGKDVASIISGYNHPMPDDYIVDCAYDIDEDEEREYSNKTGKTFNHLCDWNEFESRCDPVMIDIIKNRDLRGARRGIRLDADIRKIYPQYKIHYKQMESGGRDYEIVRNDFDKEFRKKANKFLTDACLNNNERILLIKQEERNLKLSEKLCKEY